MNESRTRGQTGARPDDERLLEALGELTGSMTQKQAAELLGVSVRTLMRAVSDKRLTPRVRDALTLWLKSDRDENGDGDEGEDGDEPLEPVLGDDSLEGLVARLAARVQALEKTVRTVPDASTDGGAATRVDTRGADTPRPRAPARAAPAPAVPGVQQQVIGRTLSSVAKPRRPFPELVTLEAEEGEDLVYGRAAPLIAEWRLVRAGHLDARRSRVEKATDWVRMCELEIALIGEHELTLPPDSYPWDRFQRRDALRRRELWLGYARSERRWARCWRFLRRVLTLGRWRR